MNPQPIDSELADQLQPYVEQLGNDAFNAEDDQLLETYNALRATQRYLWGVKAPAARTSPLAPLSLTPPYNPASLSHMTSPILRSIGDRPLSLAGHLRHVAQILVESPSSHNWRLGESCNCGLLARSITGLTSKGLDSLLEAIKPIRVTQSDKVYNTWTSLAARHCPLTGEPEADIFKRLTEAGLEPTDFAHLEYLTHPQLRAATRFQLFGKRHKAAPQVARYCLAWASLIEAHHAAHSDSEPTEAQLNAVEHRELVEIR